MKNKGPIAIIGGYDAIAKSFYSEIKIIHKKSIFINLNDKSYIKKGIYNLRIYQLRKILETLHKFRIKNLLFLGKITRPNLNNFKADGEIDKYIPALVNSYKKGDGKVLLTVLKIFRQNGFNILSPCDISNSFFLEKHDLKENISPKDKIDLNKSINLLNDLSKYDNAQSIVCINGYIIAIEAAEGTDNLLKRVVSVRKQLGEIDTKAGLLTKLPKKNQSKLVDLPVVGPKTIELAKKANLNGIAVNERLTIVHNKLEFLKLANYYDLKIYKTT